MSSLQPQPILPFYRDVSCPNGVCSFIVAPNCPGCAGAAESVASSLRLQGAHTMVTSDESAALNAAQAAFESTSAVVVIDAADASAVHYRVRADPESYKYTPPHPGTPQISVFQDPYWLSEQSGITNGYPAVQMAVALGSVNQSEATSYLPTTWWLSRLAMHPQLQVYGDPWMVFAGPTLEVGLAATFIFAVRLFVVEQQSRFTRSLELAGLSRTGALLGFSGFMVSKALIVVLCLAGLVTLTSQTGAGGFFCLVLLLFSSILALNAFARVFAAFFTSAFAATAFAFLVHVGLATVGIVAVFSPFSPNVLIASWFFPQACVAVGLSMISRMASAGLPVSLDVSLPMFENSTLGTAVLVQLLSAVCYTLLAWYVEPILGEEAGRGVCHPCADSCGRGGRSSNSAQCCCGWTLGGLAASSEREDLLREDDMAISINSSAAATSPTTDSGSPAIVQLRGLRKTYDTRSAACWRSCCRSNDDTAPVRALKGVTMDIRGGEVTALLGPNGSGKTTCMKVLLGLESASGGSAEVCGEPLERIQALRAHVGVCLQHDALMPLLTPREHAMLFAQLRGGTEADAIEALERVGLTPHTNVLVSQLSGGQRRRLSIALAIVCDPPVLLLDEPTTGCDNESRKAVWATLSARRAAGAAVILSSHDMAECEELADRVAVLDAGRLVAFETPMSLKHRLCEGYRLSVDAAAPGAAHAVQEAVAAARGTATVDSRRGGLEFLFVRGQEEALAGVCEALEAVEGVRALSVASPTLEEALVRLGTAPALGDAEDLTSSEMVRPQDSRQPSNARFAGGWKRSSDSSASTRLETPASQPASATTPSSSHLRHADKATVMAAARPEELRPSFARRSRPVSRRLTLDLSRNCMSVALRVGLPVCLITLVAVLVGLPGPSWSNPPVSRAPVSCAQPAPGLTFPFWVEVDPPQLRTVFPGDYERVAAGLRREGFGPGGQDAISLLNSSIMDSAATDLLLGPAESPTYRQHLGAAVGYHKDFSSSGDSITVGYNATWGTGACAALQTALNSVVKAAGGPSFYLTIEPYPSWLQPPSPQDNNDDNNYAGSRSAEAALGSSNPRWNPFLMSGTYIASFVPTLMAAVVAALAAAQASTERSSGSADMELLSGMHGGAYWCGHWLFQAIAAVLVVSMSLLGLTLVSPELLLPTWVESKTSVTPVVVAMPFIALIPAIPRALALSHIFSSSSGAFTVLFLGSFLASGGVLLAISSAQFNGRYNEVITGSECCEQATASIPSWSAVVPWASMVAFFFPFSGAVVLGSIAMGMWYSAVPLNELSPWDMSLGGGPVLSMMLSTVFWVVVLALLHRTRHRGGLDNASFAARWVAAALCGCVGAIDAASVPDGLIDGEDEDVQAERARALGMPDSLSAAPGIHLVTKDLRKVFWLRGGAPKVALHRTSLLASDGEVLGLLGPNGAGKSTLQRILIGAEHPTAGSFAHNNSCGFCPQADTVFLHLTTRETAQHFLRVAGLPEHLVMARAEAGMRAVAVDGFADRRVGRLSGGNRRKVSLLVAYLGGAECVLLDEAAAGIDVLARRQLWSSVRAWAAGRATVVTTHMLDEAEALCDRVAILRGGVLSCVGSMPRLRSLYGGGMLAECELHDEAATEADVISALGHGSSVVNRSGRRLRVRLPEGQSVAVSLRALAGLRLRGFGLTPPTLASVWERLAGGAWEDDDAT